MRHILISLALAALLLGIAADRQTGRASATNEQRGSHESGPAANAPILGAEVLISTEGISSYDDGYPAVAYSNQGTYMVAYRRAFPSGTQLIYLQSFTDMGTTVQPTQAMHVYGAYSQISDWPALAYDATSNNHLLVFSEAPGWSGWGTQYAIRAASVSDSNWGPKKTIWEWRPTRGLWYPHVAWNSSHDEYLVVWSARDTTTGVWTDVAGVRVAPDGTVLSNGAIIFSTAGGPQKINLAYNPGTDEYLLVWACRSGAEAFHLWGTLVRADGTISRSTFEIASFNTLISTGDPDTVRVHPSVAARQDGYIVVWQSWDSYYAKHTIYAQLLDTSGNKAGAAFPVFASSDDHINPVVLANPSSTTDTTVVWERVLYSPFQSQVWGERLGYPVPDYVLTITSPSSLSRSMPAVALGRTGYLVLYQGTPTGQETPARIYGRVWTREGMFLPLTAK